MKKATKTKRLLLTVEKVRELRPTSDHELEQVVGGMPRIMCSWTHDSASSNGR